MIKNVLLFKVKLDEIVIFNLTDLMQIICFILETLMFL